MDSRAAGYFNFSIAGGIGAGSDACGFQDWEIVAVAIRLVGFGWIGRDSAEEADFLDQIAERAGRWCLGIGDGPDTNAIDDPVFFRGADYEIVRDKGIGPFGQPEELDRLCGRAPVKNEDSRLRGNIRDDRSAGKEECEKLPHGIDASSHYKRALPAR